MDDGWIRCSGFNYIPLEKFLDLGIKNFLGIPKVLILSLEYDEPGKILYTDNNNDRVLMPKLDIVEFNERIKRLENFLFDTYDELIVARITKHKNYTIFLVTNKGTIEISYVVSNGNYYPVRIDNLGTTYSIKSEEFRELSILESANILDKIVDSISDNTNDWLDFLRNEKL